MTVDQQTAVNGYGNFGQADEADNYIEMTDRKDDDGDSLSVLADDMSYISERELQGNSPYDSDGDGNDSETDSDTYKTDKRIYKMDRNGRDSPERRSLRLKYIKEKFKSTRPPGVDYWDHLPPYANNPPAQSGAPPNSTGSQASNNGSEYDAQTVSSWTNLHSDFSVKSEYDDMTRSEASEALAIGCNSAAQEVRLERYLERVNENRSGSVLVSFPSLLV